MRHAFCSKPAPNNGQGRRFLRQALEFILGASSQSVTTMEVNDATHNLILGLKYQQVFDIWSFHRLLEPVNLPWSIFQLRCAGSNVCVLCEGKQERRERLAYQTNTDTFIFQNFPVKVSYTNSFWVVNLKISDMFTSQQKHILV